MLLSFSVPEMRPWIVSGLVQRGNPPGYARLMAGRPEEPRVKRQTIRLRGPRAERLLSQTKDGKHPGTLHLWWKSRTKERENLGCVEGFQLYPLLISHYDILAVDGSGTGFLKWDMVTGGADLLRFAIADGFDSLEAFRDYFVPNRGDRFNGVLFKW